MSTNWKQLILDNSKAVDARKLESVQSLWSGYGEIFRVQLVPESLGTLIVKEVTPPDHNQHPRGWNTDRSLQRKLKSYDVEAHWYKQWSRDSQSRVPACIASIKNGDQSSIVLEDLDASGYHIRHHRLSPTQAKSCLLWLANFHAGFIHSEPTGLWPVGTYWHLGTRPDEYNAMPEGPLKDNAVKIDQLLQQCSYQTLVHGDAKVANFCFNHDDSKVAAVDFQYVGGGCGMKDVAYFFGSCFDEHECKQYVPTLLDYYFKALRNAVVGTINGDRLEREWRELFAPAWSDYYRFLLGWLPKDAKPHAKIHSYTDDLAQQTLELPGLNQQ